MYRDVRIQARSGERLRRGWCSFWRTPDHCIHTRTARNPRYLRHDTRKAVEELATRGMRTFCLTLDSKADDYVTRIFGPKNFMVVDHVNRPPKRLPMLYAGLTR